MKKEKFELCPFCNCKDIFINSENVDMEYREGYWGECNNCGARGGFADNESAEGSRYAIEEAIKKWNTRPTEEQLRTNLAFFTTPVGSK